MKKIILLLIILNLILMACKKTPPATPCAGLAPTSADFLMYESCVDYNRPAYDDTIIYSTSATFRALDSTADYYEWHIGANTYNTKAQCIIFDNVVSANHPILDVPVYLKLKRNHPDKTCFPNDNGIDSVKKVVHFHLRNYSRLDGTFWGYLVSIPYKYFKFTAFDSTTSTYRPDLIINLMNQGDTLQGGFLGSNDYSVTPKGDHNFITYHGKLAFWQTEGMTARIDNNNNIVVNFEYHILKMNGFDILYNDTIYKTGHQTFIGKKIK